MTRAAGARGLGARAEGWGWRHGGRRAFAVRTLDLRVEPGERVLLLGASGAGKSTLLLGLAGLLGGDAEGEQEGELLVGSRPAREAQARPEGTGVGLLLQDPEAHVVLARCGDDVAFGLENTGVPPEQIWPRVRAALAAVGFPYPAEHPTSALSGGEKQRLALAGVLAMQPGLLLLDEPTANLDPDGVLLVRDTVAAVLAETGATLVVVEHRVAAWLELIDRVVVLTPGGGVLADGPPETVLHGHADELADAGVWLPHRPPRAPLRATGRTPGPPLLTAADLAVAPLGAVPAATGIALSLPAGRCLAVVGPNGAGKTTLALTAGGLLPPAAGKLAAEPALARGLDPRPARWRARQLLARIGSVFQDPEHQFLAPTVRAELEHGPRLLGVAPPARAARAGELLDRMHLAHLADANPFTLSGGEKRRLSVATALASAPALLVLDEPTFGQDARTWAELVGLLSGLLDDGRALLVVTHDLPLVQVLADDVLALGPVRVPA